VMLKVFEQKDVFHYDPARGRFRDWLGAVARNKVAELRRRPSEKVRAIGGNSQTGDIEPQAGDLPPDDVWEDAFEQAVLSVLLDVVRREMSPRAYLAFELFTIHEIPGAKVARQTGLSRNGVYRASKRALARLKELGADYYKEGRLCESVKQALRSRPPAAIEQSLTTRVAKSFSQL
jgi:RNA polymerase sigma factor (sigma-70 family)